MTRRHRAGGMSAAAFMTSFSSGPRVEPAPALRYVDDRIVDIAAVDKRHHVVAVIGWDGAWQDPHGGAFTADQIASFDEIRSATVRR